MSKFSIRHRTGKQTSEMYWPVTFGTSLISGRNLSLPEEDRFCKDYMSEIQSM